MSKKLVQIAPTSFPTHLGTGGAEKVAFEFDNLSAEYGIDVTTFAHPLTRTEGYRNKVQRVSLLKRDRSAALELIDDGEFDCAIIQMTRTKELKLALELKIPCAIIIHIAPEIAGHMVYEWMDLVAACYKRGIPLFAVSKRHAKRLTDTFHAARSYIRRKEMHKDFPHLAFAPEFFEITEYVTTHFTSAELIKPVVKGDGTFCTVSRVSAAAPLDKLFFFHDALKIPVKLITNHSNITSMKDEAVYQSYYNRYKDFFMVDLSRDDLLDQVRKSTATINPIPIDSSPCKVFESNALGVPVIIFDSKDLSGAVDLQITDHYAVVPPVRSKKDRIAAYEEAVEKMNSITFHDRCHLAMFTREFYSKDRAISEYNRVIDSAMLCAE